MKIKIGDQIEDFTLPTAEGKKFSLSQTRGQKVLLTFYRVAGCTFCNMRLMEIKRRFSELGDNFTHVGIFHAPVDALKSTWDRHGGLPFTLLADQDFQLFKKFEVERSWGKVFMAMLVKGLVVFPAVLRGFLPLPVRGHFNIAVTDVLLDENGVVTEVMYAKTTAADHFSFDRVKAHALT